MRSILCGPFALVVACPSTLNVTVVVTVKLFCDASMLFCCEMGLMVGVGVFVQRGGGAGGVRIGTKFSVLGGVGRGARTKLLPFAATASPGKGFVASKEELPLRLINELFPLAGCELFVALQLV